MECRCFLCLSPISFGWGRRLCDECIADEVVMRILSSGTNITYRDLEPGHANMWVVDATWCEKYDSPETDDLEPARRFRSRRDEAKARLRRKELDRARGRRRF